MTNQTILYLDWSEMWRDIIEPILHAVHYNVVMFSELEVAQRYAAEHPDIALFLLGDVRPERDAALPWGQKLKRLGHNVINLSTVEASGVPFYYRSGEIGIRLVNMIRTLIGE